MHWTGGWVGSIDGLVAEGKTEIPAIIGGQPIKMKCTEQP
jgi:hypothetical protein